jgi:hypothetical protein
MCENKCGETKPDNAGYSPAFNVVLIGRLHISIAPQCRTEMDRSRQSSTIEGPKEELRRDHFRVMRVAGF